jgi:type II secretory pathway pseudopilin PulG
MSATLSQKRLRGMTMTEALFGTVILALVLFGGFLALLSTLAAWTRGQATINAEVQATNALRTTADQLREAIEVFVDQNGMGITYRLPAKSTDGSYLVPLEWDGIDRRIFVNGNNQLVLDDGQSTRVILSEMVLTDPRRGNDAYPVFSAAPGFVTREVTIQLVTRRLLNRFGEDAWGRVRQTVGLRNDPVLQ